MLPGRVGYPNVVFARGKRFVYFHFSFPRCCTGSPPRSNAANPRPRRSFNHAGPFADSMKARTSALYCSYRCSRVLVVIFLS